MFKTKQSYNNILIFSRWSRKSYALFNCLKKVVHIARLSFDLCQSLLSQKPKAIRTLNLLGIDEDSDITEIQENSLLLVAIIPTTSIAKEINNKNQINNTLESPYFAKCNIWTSFF